METIAVLCVVSNNEQASMTSRASKVYPKNKQYLERYYNELKSSRERAMATDGGMGPERKELTSSLTNSRGVRAPSGPPGVAPQAPIASVLLPDPVPSMFPTPPLIMPPPKKKPTCVTCGRSMKGHKRDKCEDTVAADRALAALEARRVLPPQPSQPPQQAPPLIPTETRKRALHPQPPHQSSSQGKKRTLQQPKVQRQAKPPPADHPDRDSMVVSHSR